MSEPIERTDAALRQIENHARAARADLAALRRSPPAPAIDVEAVVREKAKLADEYAEILIQIRDEDGDLYGWTDEHQGISIVGMEIADARDWLARYDALRAALPKSAIDVEAVAKERDELRQRCDDLALIADTWALSDEDGNPWGLRITDNKLVLTDDAGDIVVDRDERTGLPILNNAARSALRLRAALGGKGQQ